MRSLLGKLRFGWKLHRVRRVLDRALALHRRREVRSDGLVLVNYAMKLSVSWRAREIHPWDRNMPEEKIAPRLVAQTMHDAEDAVERIFEAFPEADVLDLNILECDPDSNQVIMSGVVMRSDLRRFAAASIGMRLRMLGINYRLVNQHFETIGTSELPVPPIAPRTDFRFGRSVGGAQGPAHLTIKSRPRWPEGDQR
jgi:hypothetical protein